LNTLYAIGVGPGDPELLTLKAHRVLQEVTAVFVPKPGTENESVALEIAGRYIPEKARVKFLHMPMINCRRELNGYWEEAAWQVIEQLAEGSTAFLTLGDPLTYSTAAYLAETVQRLQPGTPVQFIPGVTSFSACAARVGMPLVEGNETLVLVPSVGTAKYLKDMLTRHDNCILMKVSRAFDTIVQVLEDLDLKGNAVFISRCGAERETVTRDLDSLRGTDIDYLSLMIVKSSKGGR